MIKEFKNGEVRDSAVIYRSTWEQIQMLYAQDKEMAGELAISAIEMMLTGDISSDNMMINIILKDMEVISGRNKDKHEKSIAAKRQARITSLKLDTIAEMLKENKTQVSIAAALGESKQTISNRVKIIREDYPELLCEEECQKSQVNQKNQIDDNVNVNVNDNVNDNENVSVLPHTRGDSPHSPCSPGGSRNSETKKIMFNF